MSDNIAWIILAVMVIGLLIAVGIALGGGSGCDDFYSRGACDPVPQENRIPRQFDPR